MTYRQLGLPCLYRALLVLSALLSACASVKPVSDGAALVIDDVSLVLAERSTQEAAARVVIQDGRIRCIGAPRACPAPAGARQLDGSGRFLLPGLFDAHIHTSQRFTQVAPLYLAFGITSVRDMGGFPEFTRLLQDDIRSGALLGPHIHTAGRPIDGAPSAWPVSGVAREVRTAEEARAAVRAAKDEGAGFIKLYNALPLALVQEAVNEAHRLGLKVTIDHILRGPEAVDGGVDGVEHFVPPPPLGRGLMQRFEEGDAASSLGPLLKRMQQRGVALTSTLVLMDRARGRSLAETEATYGALPPSMRAHTAGMLNDLDRGLSTFMGLTQRYACAQIRDFAAMGGTVLAGTDSYFLSSYPGDLHRELELLVGCGLTPAQALQAATSAPARWLGLNDSGVVEVGARADLLLLAANPLNDIRATRRIEWIIQGGRVYTPADVLRTVR